MSAPFLLFKKIYKRKQYCFIFYVKNKIIINQLLINVNLNPPHFTGILDYSSPLLGLKDTFKEKINKYLFLIVKSKLWSYIT